MFHKLLLMAVCSGIVVKRKVALITGVTGQVTFSVCFFTDFKDGAYLSELLLCKGYEVHGVIRRSSTFNTSRIDHIYEAQKNASPRIFFLHYGDMTDSSSLIRIISQVKPDEIYNLAAQSHVKVSFELSEYTGEVVAMGTLRLLDAIRTCNMEKHVKFYQASSSELYGKVSSSPQHECTPFHPRSPYAVAKLYAYWIVVNYRESYGLFACNGILFNHESPRRGETFVTRKITRAVSRIKMGLQASFLVLVSSFFYNLNCSSFPGHILVQLFIIYQIEQGDLRSLLTQIRCIGKVRDSRSDMLLC
ncbi:hypothetical protein AHF37_04869 [Paragonimus kellicotti]|nr:hypothetical protein AHF37_04869 [Paragonimus kellicotti]